MAKKPASASKAPPPPKNRDVSPRKRRGIWYWLAVAIVWAGIAGTGALLWLALELPNPKALATIDRPSVVHIAYADGQPFLSMGAGGNTAVALADLPPWVAQAVIATEDRRFYDHGGLDFRGIARALVVNVRAGGVREGASTITQQLAKNLFLGPERHFKRKLQEAMLALWLEEKLDKSEILELYLNRVYFGAGAYGIDAASRRYFAKSPDRLTVGEAALLAGLLKAPSRYAPTVNLAGARVRAASVIDRMAEVGFLTEAQAKQIRLDQIAIREAPVRGRYFVDWLMDLLPEYVGGQRGEITVVTTLDRTAQEAADRAVTDALRRDGTSRGFGQAALVALAPDGAVRALVGGSDYATAPFNRAIAAHRQPGSAFKPIVYLAGIEAGLEPSSTFVDAPITVGGWTPSNFDNAYAGAVTLSDALARSINTVAVQVSERAGRTRVAAAARRLGIASEIPAVPSIALGSAEVTPIELTGAYAAIANGGTGVWPYAVVAIRDESGVEIYRREGSGPGPAMATATAGKLARMMSEVIARGTGRAAQLDRPAAGKTGTSQDFRDAWFVGFTADLTAGVWVGNDDNTPMNRVTGGDVPARIWRDFMLAAHRGKPARDLTPLSYRSAPVAATVAAPPTAVPPRSEPATGGPRWNDPFGARGRE